MNRARRERVEGGLNDLAGVAPTTGWSVRGLSKWAANTRCGTSAAAFAARVDLDRLMVGTGYDVEYGQSPFMLARGRRVESLVRENGYAALIPILREQLGFEPTEVAALNLKEGYPPNTDGLELRATATRNAIRSIVRGTPDAVNIIEGAVLEAQLGQYTARFEADAIGARLGPVLHGLEVKSWPLVDGRADDPGKATEALRQLGFYLLLLRGLTEQLGYDPRIVSTKGLLVTPKNVGLTLVGSARDLDREVAFAEATLDRLPDATDYAAGAGPGVSFGPASAQSGRAVDDRLEHLSAVTDTYGVHYQESCLSSCGMAKFCRARMHGTGSPSICGTAAVRFLPGVRSLARAADLGDGAPPTETEQRSGVAHVLGDAGALYRHRLAAGEGAA